jgi:hypothetical protein
MTVFTCNRTPFFTGPFLFFVAFCTQRDHNLFFLQLALSFKRLNNTRLLGKYGMADFTVDQHFLVAMVRNWKLDAFLRQLLEGISKIWIKFEGKARGSEKAESRQRRDEQYSLSWLATQPSSFRQVFEMASRLVPCSWPPRKACTVQSQSVCRNRCTFAVYRIHQKIFLFLFHIPGIYTYTI